MAAITQQPSPGGASAHSQATTPITRKDPSPPTLFGSTRMKVEVLNLVNIVSVSMGLRFWRKFNNFILGFPGLETVEISLGGWKVSLDGRKM